MKNIKIISLILALATIASLLCACKKDGTTAPTDTTGAPAATTPEESTAPADPNAPDTALSVPDELFRRFRLVLEADPDASLEKLANTLALHPYLDGLELDIYTEKRPTAYEPFFMGFKSSFKLPEYTFSSSITDSVSGTFVCNIFELADGADPQAFADTLLENADIASLGENAAGAVCKTGAAGKYVFFVICKENLKDTYDPNAPESVKSILKRLRMDAGLYSTIVMAFEMSGERSFYFSGIKNNVSLVENDAAACEYAMGGGFSIVLVKVKDAKDVKTVADEMATGLDPMKWICMGAETVKVETNGHYVLGVMGNADECNQITGIFKNLSVPD